MPFSSVFNTVSVCKENKCKVNQKNIKKIYKPDDGFLDTRLEKRLFSSTVYKICDCIVICQNDDIIIIEILCGKLTYHEFKEKCEQLENCCKVADYKKLKQKITKIVLLHKNRESNKKNPQFRKKLLNPKICSIPLQLSKESTFDIGC